MRTSSAPIYLDHAATTPLRVEVREAMEPFLARNYANPSSVYRLAQEARAALDTARDSVATCLGVRPGSVIFTSGGTESDNAAIKGAYLAACRAGGHIVTTAIEHHAVLHPIEELVEHAGCEVTQVPVGWDGIVDPDEIGRAIRPDTVLVSVMWANNEIGTVQPIEEVARITAARGVAFHVDAVQAAGLLPIDLSSVPIDLLTISAHKFYGPKGIGALIVRPKTAWWPLLTGGGQERNRRAGTENVPAIVGMGCALSLICAERDALGARLADLRDRLTDEILSRVTDTQVNGSRERRLPNNVNLSFADVPGDALLVGLDLEGIMASSGSACTSGSLDPSHVLQALGLSDARTRGSLRLTLGRENTVEEMRRTVDTLQALVARLRRVAPRDRVDLPVGSRATV